MYAFCMVAGYVRAVLHWLTPLPNQGIGCRMALPTRDRAKETLAALNKWQSATRQQLEVTFSHAAGAASTASTASRNMLRRSIALAEDGANFSHETTLGVARNLYRAASDAPRFIIPSANRRQRAGSVDLSSSEQSEPASKWSPAELARHLRHNSSAFDSGDLQIIKEAVARLEISLPTSVEHLMSATVTASAEKRRREPRSPRDASFVEHSLEAAPAAPASALRGRTAGSCCTEGSFRQEEGEDEHSLEAFSSFIAAKSSSMSDLGAALKLALEPALKPARGGGDEEAGMSAVVGSDSGDEDEPPQRRVSDLLFDMSLIPLGPPKSVSATAGSQRTRAASSPTPTKHSTQSPVDSLRSPAKRR